VLAKKIKLGTAKMAVRRDDAELYLGFIGMIADMCQVSHIARSHDMNSSWLFGFVRVDVAKKS
jgi:hypothetical protein